MAGLFALVCFFWFEKEKQKKKKKKREKKREREKRKEGGREGGERDGEEDEGGGGEEGEGEDSMEGEVAPSQLEVNPSGCHILAAFFCFMAGMVAT